MQGYAGGRAIALGANLNVGQALHLLLTIGLNGRDFGHVRIGARPAAALHHEVAGGRGAVEVQGPRARGRQPEPGENEALFQEVNRKNRWRNASTQNAAG